MSFLPFNNNIISAIYIIHNEIEWILHKGLTNEILLKLRCRWEIHFKGSSLRTIVKRGL